MINDQTASEHHHIYSTPQKHASNKIAPSDGHSPLVYNANSNLIENTPQVHKRKASFKMVKSVTSKQDEFNFADSRYSGARDVSNVKSIEAGGP